MRPSQLLQQVERRSDDRAATDSRLSIFARVRAKSPFARTRHSIGAFPAVSTDDVDPIAAALRPPDDESAVEKALRLEQEHESLKRAQKIERRLKADAQREKKERQGERRVLLLGHAGAGKVSLPRNKINSKEVF